MFRPVNSRRHPNDRFIPRRMNINYDFLNENRDNNSENDRDAYSFNHFINKAKLRYNQIKYREALRNVLIPLDIKILNFFPPKNFLHQNNNTIVWPVKSRKEPIIGPPSVILDMPQFDTNICHQIADWSSDNCLATVFEGEVHMWYPGLDLARAVTATERKVQFCVKWKKHKPHFSIGLRPHLFGIWDTEEKKLIHKTYCCMYCDVYAMEWIKDELLLTGCSKGVLKLLNSELTCLKNLQGAHDGPIICITSSCKENYVATSGLNREVLVWNFPNLDVHFRIIMPAVVKALAWHPWNNAIFATGVNISGGGVFAIWNINTQTKVAHDQSVFKNATINYLTFNPITGELVISCFKNAHEVTQPGGVIVVLSNMKRVVEELIFHEGPIPYLLWGNQGKLLASVSADENLCIWDFFGVSGSVEDVYKKVKSVKNNDIDMENLRVFNFYNIR